MMKTNRLHLNPEWLCDYKRGRPVAPLYVEISPTGRCNHSCSFCSERVLGYPRRWLETKRALLTMENMAREGVKAVMFGGEGEPLLHPDFATLANAAQWTGLHPALTTNAVMLDGALQRQCITDLLWIKASINAGDMITYGQVHRCRPTDWFAAWSNLGNIIKRRLSFQWPLTVGTQMVILPQNVHQIEGHLKNARRAGVDQTILRPLLTPLGVSPGKNLALSLPDNIDRIISKYTCDTYRVILRKDSWRAAGLEHRDYDWCRAAGNAWGYIDSAGDLWACSCHMDDRRFRMGNVLGGRSFADVWFKARPRIQQMMRGYDVANCRRGCRMDQVNVTLSSITVQDPWSGHI